MRLAMTASQLAGAALCAVLLLPGARADELFQFELRGEGFHWYSPYECPDFECQAEGYAFPWTGTVNVVTSSDADGVYTGSGLNVTMKANHGGFSGFLFPGPVSARISGGQVVSLEVVAEYEFTRTSISGLTATYDFGGCHHCGYEHATAFLSPVVPIPEPSAWALMSLGLLAVGAGATKRSRSGR